MKKIAIALFLIISVYEVTAQSVHWAVTPTYNKVEQFTDRAYKIRENNKIGILDISGKEILPAKFDSITDFCENKALVLTKEGNKYRLSGVLYNNNNQFKSLESNTYYITRYSRFSEGLLCISNSKNKQGFINEDGDIMIECKYAETHPFSQGRASVKLPNKKFMYLDQEGRAIILEPGEGDIIFASTFCNDEAVVYTTNRKGYVIGLNGETLRPYDCDIMKAKINPHDYTILESGSASKNREETPDIKSTAGDYLFCDGGLYGYKNNEYLILPAQFTYASGFIDNYALVKHDNKYGFLELINGKIEGRMKNSTIEVSSDVPEMATYIVTLPHQYEKRDITLRYTDEKGAFSEINSTTTSGTSRNFIFRPDCQKNQREKKYNFALFSEGLLLYKDSATIKYSYPIKIKLSEPMVESSKADANDLCYAYADITNSSNQHLNLKATFYINNVAHTTTAEVAPGQTHRARVSFTVKEKKVINIYVKLSNGLVSKNKEIEVEAFY